MLQDFLNWSGLTAFQLVFILLFVICLCFLLSRLFRLDRCSGCEIGVMIFHKKDEVKGKVGRVNITEICNKGCGHTQEREEWDIPPEDYDFSAEI